MPLSDRRIEPATLERGAGGLPVEEPFYTRADDGVDLRELFDILLRGKWIIAGAFLAGVLLTGLYGVVTPSQYASYVLMLVEKQDSDLASVLPTDPGAAFLRNERNLANELLVLRQSYPLAETVAEEILATETVPGTGRRFTVLDPRDDGLPLTARDVAFRLQYEVVTASLEGTDADALRVTAASTDPAEAAYIANLYAAAFEARTRESSRAGIAASREFLEEQVENRGVELEALDDEVRSYMQREGAVALDEESSRTVQRIGELQAQRDQVGVEIGMRRASLDALETELRRLEPRLAERLGSGLDAELAQAQERLAALQAELDTYLRENPALRTADAADAPARVTQVRREIERTRERIATVSDQLTDQSLAAASGPGQQAAGFARAADLRARIADERVALDGLLAQRDRLEARLGEYEADLQRIPAQSIELAQLQRERLAREQLYGALEANLQEARVAEESQLGYAQIIRPAFVAAEPFAPSRARNVVLGGLLGLMLGAALAIAKVRLDHRIHRPDDLAGAAAPLVSTIPSTDELIKRDFEGRETVVVDGREIDSHLVTLLNPMAAASEAYRGLRTSVQFSRPDAAVQTVLVTSANPGEGKSTTAANLAVVMAQAGRRVLLVDGDLRKPTGHKKFGTAREPGLVQHLFSDGPLDLDALPQPADDLWLLPAGRIAPNPSELLGSKRMREVLDDVRNRFDLIVIDAPPVLAATDAVLLSTQADATLVVCRAGRTKDYELRSALDELGNVGAHVIGTVLNGFDVTKSYGYKYKYAYRYGSDYAYGSPSA
jgi:tyrosine-protein kinase Etk/Wzc